MPCHTSEATDAKIDKVMADVQELIAWAEADAQHADEHDAPDTAEDDRLRAKALRRVLTTLDDCKRY